jgi:YbbR domain-containing protein
MDSNNKSIPLNTLRLVSLFLALILWVAFSGRGKEQSAESTRVSRGFEVALVYHGLPGSMEVNSSVIKVYVLLSGDETEMKTLNEGMLVVKLDLSNLGSGKHQVPIPNESVQIPEKIQGIKVESIQPRVINFDIQKKIRKKLKVLVHSKGVAAENFELDSIKVTPDVVTVYGPERDVKDLTFLIAEPIDISGASEDLSGRVTFNYEKQFPRNTTMEYTEDLTYLARIVEKTQHLKLGTFKPEFIGNTKLKFRPRSVKVSIQGPVTVIDQIQKDWLHILVSPPSQEDSARERVLSFKWSPPLPRESSKGEESTDELEWDVLARLEEVEVQITPATVKIKK